MKLAADANVLLSALIGGQAMRVLRHQAIGEILTTEEAPYPAPRSLRISSNRSRIRFSMPRSVGK